MPEVAEGGRPLLRLSVRPSVRMPFGGQTDKHPPPSAPAPAACRDSRWLRSRKTMRGKKKNPASRSRTSNSVVSIQACDCNCDTRRSSAHNAPLHCLSTPMHLTHLARDCGCSSSYCCFCFQQGVCTVPCSSIMLKTKPMLIVMSFSVGSVTVVSTVSGYCMM